ncbi:ClpX C4-type zinc finger protein [Klebsiella quasipneumoniae]|uniref:ClpX C4-type zinc finger protein n=1 Tax=Klebsiella quasipneumoniae TaxID=1463165 RepID=UPI002FF8B7D1
MKNQETGEFVCDFCGKHQDKVAKMFTSHSDVAAICNDCVALCVDVILQDIKTKGFVEPLKKGGAA